MQHNQIIHMNWNEFKAFLMTSLGEFNAFVSHAWTKLREDA